MKRINSLILGVAALAATANITFAQEGETQREQADQLRKQAATIVADQDARVEQLRKAVEAADAQTARILAQNRSADGKTYSTRLKSIVARANAPSRMLVIPQDADGAKGIAEVEEDLNVMAHILDKVVSGDGDKSARAMGIVVPPRPPGSAAGPQNLFIEGYGALFFLNVNYPLVPPPVKDKEPNAKEKTSSEWEDARQEITQPQRYGRTPSGDVIVIGGDPAEYDADKVEELKKDLIASLKNATHIRKLRSDESVTVVINAPRPAGNAELSDQKTKPTSVLWEDAVVGAPQFQTFGMTPGDSHSTKLILRARKSDAEAFQKGNLSFDEFRKKVAVILY